MQGEAAQIVDDRVAGVAAALEADDDIGRSCQGIGDLALAFISPGGADDGGDGHGEFSSKQVTDLLPAPTSGASIHKTKSL